MHLRWQFLSWAIPILFFSVFLTLIVFKLNFDFSRLIVVGERFVDKATLDAQIFIKSNSDGYDGQFNYRLALDPFTSHLTAHGITLDKPIIRQRRIVYPILSFLFSLGQSKLVPFSLLLVNVIALWLYGYIVNRNLQLTKYSSSWLLCFAFIPSFILSLSRDLPEILLALWILLFVLLERGKHYWPASLALLLALLTKETAIILALSYLAASIPTRLTPSKSFTPRRFFLSSYPIFIFALYHLYLTFKWPVGPATFFMSNIGLPFAGIFELLAKIPLLPLHTQLVYLAELVFLFWFTQLVITHLHHSTSPTFLKFAWLIHLLLAVSFSNLVWVEDWSFIRVLVEFFLYGLIILSQSSVSFRSLRRLTLAQISISSLLALDILRYRL